ncbi:DUF6521 family protein [Pasteurella atlantica]|uniref:DUF6521 family protein n=2 Tax=Pasteurellaceae TaxID=712 RepID=A0ACC6HJG2_9PAST|nr:three component ABC system middle component [Pasteurella atlantica]MDP8050882.1 DUF6521 family protein [Pasteurella atlantica]MDP8101702.1 DUF6521 family protein [Pasteurella atlantica]MDP8104152.1 DUF6521 family protein [Pasteurella atlantica]MDP8147538.1 DUF6521 family protein [Pasteurella atlantica]
MSKYVDSLYKVNNNIFVFTPLLVVFYEKLTPSPKNLLLSYLVLPLVLYGKSQTTIKKSNKTSSISTFLASNQKEKRENVYGLPERIQEYKEITNQCMLYAIGNGWIKLNEDLSVEVIKKQNNNMVNLECAYKASSKLCNIFKDLDVVSIYRLLGVKQL